MLRRKIEKDIGIRIANCTVMTTMMMIIKAGEIKI